MHRSDCTHPTLSIHIRIFEFLDPILPSSASPSRGRDITTTDFHISGESGNESLRSLESTLAEALSNAIVKSTGTE
jgi:hypothetical protein